MRRKEDENYKRKRFEKSKWFKPSHELIAQRRTNGTSFTRMRLTRDKLSNCLSDRSS